MSLRLAHCSDLHLGFRAYQRLTSAGLNVRECDTALTFTRLVDRLIAVAPDVIVIAGDVFHSVRPGNPAITHAFAQFKRLRDELPDTVVLMIAGNHDAPKTSDAGCILPLFTNLGIQVVDRGAERIFLPALELSILAVPDTPGMKRPEFVLDDRARYNVLVLHGEVEGVKQGNAASHRKDAEIKRAELYLDDWDYCAFGHFHQYEELAPNAFYSGSIDFSSSNPWQEIATPKGFIVRDLVTGAHTFYRLPPSRPAVDLPPIDARELSAAQLDDAIRSTVDSCEGGIDGKIVRLIIDDVSHEVRRALDHKLLKDYQRRALNLNLDMRRPEYVRGVTEARTPATKRKSIDEMLVEIFMNPERSMPPDVSREAAIAGARYYLENAPDPYAHEVKPEKSAQPASVAA